MSKTVLIENSSKLFNEASLGEILSVGKDGFDIKIAKKLGTAFRGKNSFELVWDTKLNNASYSHVEKDDPSHLNVHGTTCYTYYQTTPNFTDEDFSIDLEYKVNTNDNYFYLGIINETVVPTSNCMCCTIANGFYFQPNGDIVLSGSRTNNPKIAAAKGVVHNVNIRVQISTKEMYITMDDNDEVGPLKFSGTKFRFVSGSCNSVNGYIKINNASWC